jgi:pilus assembly protein Flp/PilA
MTLITTYAKRLFKSEDGAVAIEYALMLALIIIACLMTLAHLGQSTNRFFRTISEALESPHW